MVRLEAINMAGGSLAEIPIPVQASTTEVSLSTQPAQSAGRGGFQEQSGGVNPQLTANQPELPQAGLPAHPAQIKGPQLPKVFSEEEVRANARLIDEKKRYEAAGKLFGSPLTSEQETWLLKMHKVGENRSGSGVYGYDRSEIEEKIKIGREAVDKGIFSKEQYQALIRAGLAGRIPDNEFAALGFNPDDFTGRLRPIADLVFNMGMQGRIDERVLVTQIRRVNEMIDGGTLANAAEFALAQQLEVGLYELKDRAESIVSPETGRQLSAFEQTLFNIAELNAYLKNFPGSPVENARLQTEITNLNELMRLGNEAGLFQIEKPGLYDLLRLGRIDVSIRDKREGHKLRSIGDAKTRSEQTSVESEAFWNDPRYPERRALRATLGGAIDYFNRGSMALIDWVARNPRMKDASGNLIDILMDRDYSELRQDYAGIDGIIAAWTYRWISGKGVAESVNNFEEMRKKLEQERQERPRFMKHPWYRSVEFFVDDISELGVATRDFVRYATANLQRGESNVMLQNLQEEQTAVQSAFKDAIMFFEREANNPTIKWIASEMNSAFSMAGIGFFQHLGSRGLEGFEYFTKSWAEGLRKTNTSVNYEDALTLDEDGMFLYIAEKLCENDGIFYRFGSDSPEFPTMDEMKTYLDEKREEIIEEAAKHRLRSIANPTDPNYLLRSYNEVDGANLLNFTGPLTSDHPYFQVQGMLRKLHTALDAIDARTISRGGVVTTNGWEIYVGRNKGDIPMHRAFVQAKIHCDLKDAQDILAGKTIGTSRWDIYKREARAWEDFARQGKEDSRDPYAKVGFTHPLARLWKNDQEFGDMYEETGVTDDRRARARYLITRVEDYLRFNMQDVKFGSARINFRKKGPDGSPIHNGEVERVKAATVVVRDELHRTMSLDEGRSFLDKRFKVTYILRQMGYRPELPAYGLFSLGADDTVRNTAIKAHFYAEPEFAAFMREVELSKAESDQEVENYKAELKRRQSPTQIEADPDLIKMQKLKAYIDVRRFRGSNAKSIIVKFTEDERLAVQAVQRAVRHPNNRKYGNSGGDYDNFPGEDNPGEEGGTKFWKNIIHYEYGTSRGTVRIDGMIPFVNSGVLDRISELGGWTPKYVTGLRHRGDEVELAEEGSLLIDPKDTQGYLTRLKSAVTRKPLITGAGDAEKKPGVLMEGFFSGMYLYRELGTHSEYFSEDFVQKSEGKPMVIQQPEAALKAKYLAEIGKKAYLDTTAAVVAPLVIVMRANRELETGYGYAQGTSKNINSLLLQDIGYWMDNFWHEYIGDFGYAVDGMLHTARSYMFVSLKEAGLIWPEQKTKKLEGWDDISRRLARDLPEDLRIGVPLGSFMYPATNSIKVGEDSPYLQAKTRNKEEIRKQILKDL